MKAEPWVRGEAIRRLSPHSPLIVRFMERRQVVPLLADRGPKSVARKDLGGPVSPIRTPRRISVFDTTLRDGEQAPRNAMTPEQKLEMALRIEALGVDRVEAGFPAASPRDFEATRLISKSLKRAQFVSFCRAVRGDVQAAVEAGGTTNHQVE